MKLYLGEVSNFQKALLWKRDHDLAQIGCLNRDSIGEHWGAHQAFFHDPKNKRPQPDETMLIPGFALRRDVRDIVFPDKSAGVEFLSFDVEGEGWEFANSICSTMAYDESKSSFIRSIEGQIYYIFRLVVTDSSLKCHDVFTISDSNRAWPIFTETFVQRLELSKLNRMNFREVGEIV